MRIIIVGAGTIGENLAKTLTEEAHEVYLIESNEQRAEKVGEKLDVKVIVGHGADPDALKRAVIFQADLVIAVTDSDETNMVVSSLAAAYGAKRRIARVRSLSLNKALEEFGYQKFNIDEIINPEDVAAQAIVKAIEAPGACEVADFANGKILLRAFDIPKTSPLCGLKIQEIRNEDFPWPMLVVAIVREGVVFIPKGDADIQALDMLYVLLPAPSLGEFLTFVDPNIRKPKKVIIYGAHNIGEKVAFVLSQDIRDIVLVEEDEKTAEKVAGRIGSVRIIHGSACEADILKECGIETADVFIATSENDHSNLVSAVLAKKMGAKATIITTQHPDYMAIIDALDIDVIINPRFLAADQIRRLVRGKGISAVTKLMEGNAEAMELIPEEGSAVTKVPLKEIHFPKNSIVGAIYRGEEVILADGNTQIQAGEKVIVFCQEDAVKKLHDLFTRKKFL
ncbi:MAG: Trk system potassium transporter TrkA [Candidatus Omnitrophota bacterium]